MRHKESPIVSFTNEEKAQVTAELKTYLEEELELEVTGLQCSLLLRYITDHLGKYFYNKAIGDAAVYMAERVEDMYALVKD